VQGSGGCAVTLYACLLIGTTAAILFVVFASSRRTRTTCTGLCTSLCRDLRQGCSQLACLRGNCRPLLVFIVKLLSHRPSNGFLVPYLLHSFIFIKPRGKRLNDNVCWCLFSYNPLNAEQRQLKRTS
jgi:hypothetical protein